MARVRGELEAQVMRLLWATDSPQTAREIQAGFGADAPAITTVLTVLDRLGRKGLVQRSDARTNITFRPAQSESDRAVQTMLESLQSTGDRQAVLLRFAGDLDRDDAELLREALQGRGPGRSGEDHR